MQKDFAILGMKLDNLRGGRNARGSATWPKIGSSPPSLIFMSGLPFTLIGAASNQSDLTYILSHATVEAKAIIALLFVFSIAAWFVMLSKIVQMRRARKLDRYFGEEFTAQKNVLEMFDRKLQVEGCPLYVVYQAGCSQLDTRLRGPTGERARQHISLKNMEHIKRAIENVVARESLKLESGLILLAIAVSGAPFLGLLGTVWGVMSTFAGIAQQGSATMAAMAPGVSAALVTTVAGLLVAIPSMFGYNWLVHNLRAFTVELDNFAQELVSKMESEFLQE
jgi:biopolymer transport protein ExbB/TolQ